MRVKFASLQHPAKYGYAFDTESTTMSAPVRSEFMMFETYGDGLCQHSGEWSITNEHLADYLASICAFLLETPEEEQLMQHLSYALQTGISNTAEIAFCAGIVFKESDKHYASRRFYSVELKRLSSSQSKEHDKRYRQVCDWNNGTPEAIYRMLVQEWFSDLARYGCADSIRRWTFDNPDYSRKPGNYMPLTGEFLKWFKGQDREKHQDMRRAYEACQYLVESYRLRSNAQSQVDSIKRGIARAKEQAVSICPSCDAGDPTNVNKFSVDHNGVCVHCGGQAVKEVA